MSRRTGRSGSADPEERLRRLVARGDPTSVADLSPGGDLGAVQGTVETHAGTVRGPASGDPAVLVEYERGRNRDGRYDPVEGRVEAVPFLVDDGTGRVLVDPAGYEYGDGTLPVSPGKTDRFEGDESGENVRPVEDEPVLPWVHVEASIRPGDAVYVVGSVSRADDPDLPDGTLRIGPVEPSGEFLVTDLSRPTLVEELRPSSRLPQPFWQFALLGLIVVAIVVGAVALLLINFG